MQNDVVFPPNLASLHSHECFLRNRALEIISSSDRMQLHLRAVETAMELGDMLRQFPTDDENLKVIQVLGMRTFNAFGAGVKLAMSGYFQNSILIMRDVLETVFLINYFSHDRDLIQRWRIADKKTRMSEFSPVKVREALDLRDGFTEKKRFAMYELFSELAGHPSMKSVFMMRPQRNGDAVIGPFMEAATLEAALSEMGRLAIQVGEQLDHFFPASWEQGLLSRLAFAKLKQLWLATFYPQTSTLPANAKS